MANHHNKTDSSAEAPAARFQRKSLTTGSVSTGCGRVSGASGAGACGR